MPNIKMRIRGLNELHQKIKTRLQEQLYRDAMHQALEEGKALSQGICPVATGFMRSQIHFARTGRWAYQFRCDCAYASYNEWGWFGIPDVGTATQPVFYKGGYRPFMRVGMLHASDKMKKYIKQILVEGRFY